MIIIKSVCNDKHYNKYKYLFNYLYNKFNLINQNILYNFMLHKEFGGKNICKIPMKYSFNESFYNIIIKKNDDRSYPGFDFKYFIIQKYLNKSKSYLVIANNKSIIINNYNNIHIKYKYKIDTILFNDANYLIDTITEFILNFLNKFNSGKIFSSLIKSIYLQFLINLKTNTETNNILIPKTKYDLISCHLSYLYGLSISASYSMTLQLPNIIATIAMALKNIAKNGTLLLFWSIVNVNIPIIKKILSILAYGFKTVEIIDNDNNQNLLIGVPEYYIKCEGYKDNISDIIINKLLDIAIESIDYTYDTCDVLDYYEDYTKKNPNHSLFYNKKEESTGHHHSKKTLSSISHSKHSLTKKTSHSVSDSTTDSKSDSTSEKKSITPFYYIEDINIHELDKIMENSKLQFEVSLLMNKLESIFVGYFKMVNNLIVNAIATNKNGELVVKKEAILQKDITNLSKLINMFEYNKLPYNKHALNVVLNKQDEILDHFYSLDNPVNHKLIKYEDKTSKVLIKNALEYFYAYNTSTKINTKSYDFSMINDYYNRIKLALQVKNNLISDVSKYEHKIPNTVEYILHDFSGGLCQYLNNKYKTLPIQIGSSFVKLWEILTIFSIIPTNTESLKVLHLCEAPGQMILSLKYWIESKCHNLEMKNYEWMANTLNPYEAQNRYKFDKDVSRDMYGLIKHNYDKWLWGNDNTGDITKSENIKSIMMDIKNKWINKGKLDLIISDGSISFTNNDKLLIQKLDFAQVVAVLACSSIGGSCCIKHFIPYVNLNDPSINISGSGYSEYLSKSVTEGSALFISYLYLYYVSFDSVSFYKPNSSNSDDSEFYVVCKGFKGIEQTYLESLFNVLDNFQLNDTLIDKSKIPETFLVQIKNFLEQMSNTNILTIEKANLLLTCYKNMEENDKKANNVLKCNNFFDKNKIDGITLPKYKEWIKIYNFQ